MKFSDLVRGDKVNVVDSVAKTKETGTVVWLTPVQSLFVRFGDRERRFSRKTGQQMGTSRQFSLEKL